MARDDVNAGLVPGDVPYGEDWHDADVAWAWSETADGVRPWRKQIRAAFAERIAAAPEGARVLELGSGPGFLAESILRRCPGLARYVLFDLSEAMLALARTRVARHAAAEFVRGDFKTGQWSEAVGGPFDFVVSMQAVHELRHKRHAQDLYRRIHALLVPGGQLLVCDHLPLDASEKSRTLYQTEAEQLGTLGAAGFANAEVALAIDKLRLYAGRR